MDLSDIYSAPAVLPFAGSGSLIGLLGGILADIGDPSPTRRLLMDRLAGQLSADAWLWSVLRLKPAAPAPSVLPVFVESSDGPVGGPLPWKGSRAADFARCVGKSLSTHRPAACVGSDFVSLHPLPESGAGRAASSVCLCVILHRRRGRPPFTAGEIGPVHGLLSVLDRLYVADRMAPPGYGLAPRPREVFLMLLRGHARKEIADALGISLNTVHGYVRDIFRHFGVSSHAELVARFARSNPRCKAHAGMIGTGAGSPFPPSDTALS